MFVHLLHLCTFKMPTLWEIMSKQGDADCAFKMRNSVNDKIFLQVNYIKITIKLILLFKTIFR